VEAQLVKRWPLLLAPVIVAFVCAAGAATEALAPPDRPLPAPPPEPPGTRHFLWEVSSLTNKIYLYGTIHAGRRDWFPLPAAVEEAFNASPVLVVEADVTDTEAMNKSAPSMLLRPPDTLKDHVEANDYDRFLKLLPRYGVTESQVANLKPFLAVSMLVFGEWARNGYLPQYGIDGYLIRRARAELKPVLELEGIESQMQLMQGLGDGESRTLFGGTITALEDGLTGEQINGMVKAWREGDPKTLLEIARKYNDRVPGAKEFEEKFIWSRHEAMAKHLEAYLNDSKERHFVAVGSLHLAGERGLVEMLKKRGYMVVQR
jgi:uncharacterized protein YbaP (TraB family)